ncbi:MAG: beta-ketoacyl-ACP synthase II [Bacteroidales bacterium]|jgi:3-oxoacyl-[acyl-carrier-protein] synthase II|nr:beta-ketoacyl-ACP synthase II [Bacteroidales bacterium]
MELKRVVVTGMGTINPLGHNIIEFWDNLKSGVSGAGPITRFNPEKFKTRFACEVKDYDPAKFFDRKSISKMDLFTQFAMIATDEGMKQAGLENADFNHERAGVIWGSGIGGINVMTDEVIEFTKGDGTPKFSPFFIPKMIGDIAAGQISMKYDLRGPNYATVSACASSTHAIIDAFNWIRLGKADIMITGGSESPIGIAALAGFNSMKALSTRNDDPKTASRPFDKDRDGFVIGEGGGCLILEEYEHAKARGAKILCEVAGGGASADAHHITAPHPEGRGAAQVMRMALEDGNVKPEEIDYINVHGTSTGLGDKSESLAIKQVFGEHAYNLSISSTKSMTGHLLGGAGAIESIACVLAMQNNTVPPTINFQTPDPDIDPKLDITPNVAKAKTIKAALNNTFGFGGHNASVVFKKL